MSLSHCNGKLKRFTETATRTEHAEEYTRESYCTVKLLKKYMNLNRGICAGLCQEEREIKYYTQP